MIRVIIIGSGNVAMHLYRAMKAVNTIDIIQCYNRRNSTLHPDQKSSSVTSDISKLKEADIYIIAVSDISIATVSKQLQFTGRLVVHTSGSVDMSMIDNSQRKGVLYPLQSFSSHNHVDFSTVPICIESTYKEDYAILEKLARSLSKKVYSISSEQRKTIHLAAVFVNNFTNHLYHIGKEICIEKNIPFDILHPLIQETSSKILAMSPKDAQTGPAKRNDTTTLNQQIESLTDPIYKELYKSITKSIQHTYGKEL
ncbi:Rossmann-like and DUF2520 domain-containing protein [Aquimarina sp. W85]|uniref:Rossmann-like and DUF2520 domain-containing protein n=1 Tax=Aquimarina rhodophyticola TaxID=3342246 RepID=UPI003671837A